MIQEGSRMSKLLEQFLKFGVVGVVATLLDYGILMVLSQLCSIDPALAGGISFSVSLVFNYLASIRFVFARKEDLSRKAEFAIFVVLSLVGLSINQLVMWVGVSALGGQCACGHHFKGCCDLRCHGLELPLAQEVA